MNKFRFRVLWIEHWVLQLVVGKILLVLHNPLPEKFDEKVQPTAKSLAHVFKERKYGPLFCSIETVKIQTNWHIFFYSFNWHNQKINQIFQFNYICVWGTFESWACFESAKAALLSKIIKTLGNSTNQFQLMHTEPRRKIQF
jgi:hypothetical protein